jgi:glycosyltransferase involved in cell wall biosynthesis
MGASRRRTADEHQVADLLWLSAETPDVYGGGGQRRQYHQIAALIQGGVAVAVATVKGPQDDTSISQLVPVYRFEAQRFRRRNQGLEKAIKAIAPNRALVAHVESVRQVLPELERACIPFLVDFHNVLSRWHDLNGEKRSANLWRERERTALRAATRATACSAEEQRALAALGTNTPIDVCAHGIDPEEWPSVALSDRREPAIAMFGSWAHQPNRIGAEWLSRQVWPRVYKAVPSGRLLFIGPSQLPPWAFEHEHVEVLGRVVSLAEVLGRVRVAVVPIRRGIGARVKFIESLASGAAVVSTTPGCEGFAADGVFVRADDPESFAAACVELLVDGKRACDLGERGRELAFSQYTWGQVARPILEFARGTSPEEPQPVPG